MDKDITGEERTRRVWIGERELTPYKSQKVWNHSPDGFNWGYGGSGPAQLALAILLEFAPVDTAKSLHQKFKWDVVSKWEGDFIYLKNDLELWLSEHGINCSPDTVRED